MNNLSWPDFKIIGLTGLALASFIAAGYFFLFEGAPLSGVVLYLLGRSAQGDADIEEIYQSMLKDMNDNE